MKTHRNGMGIKVITKLWTLQIDYNMIFQENNLWDALFFNQETFAWGLVYRLFVSTDPLHKMRGDYIHQSFSDKSGQVM